MSNNNGEPRTVKELYIYVRGEFKLIKEEIGSIKDEMKFKMKLVFSIGGAVGAIFTAVVIAVLKASGGI